MADVDWLPPGWTVNVKLRSYGRKDKYYIHPSNGLKFSSKAEVLRYLKSSKEARKPKKRNKVDIETTAAENLPPGWIKELRIKKKGRSIRKDPFYIDPVTGRYFNSLQGVYRYLQCDDSGQTESIEQNHNRVKFEDHSQSSSGEPKEQRLIGKREDKTISRRKKDQSEVKPNGGEVVSAVESVDVTRNTQVEQIEECESKTLEVSDTQQPASRAERYAYRMRRRKEVNETTIRESVGEDHRLKSGSRIVAPKKSVMQKETYVEQKVREDDPMAGGLLNKLQKVTGTEYCEDEIITNKTPAINIVVSETHGPEQRRENNSVREGEQQQENVAPRNKRKNMNRKSRSELPCRTSKRLANVEADTSIEITPSRRPRVTAKVEIITTESNSHIGPSGEENINIIEKKGYFEEPNEQPTICKYPTCRREQELLVRSLFEDLSCIEDLDSVGVDNEDEKDAGKLVDDDPTLENLFMDPCYEFAIKTLTGDIPIENLNKVGDSNPVCSDQAPGCSSVRPPDNLWGDPTFEFAVKMLTSDLPAKESVNSSGTSVCDGLSANPSLANSSNLFSGFDSEKKPCVRQKGLQDPSLPHAVNGQARKFGGL